MKPGKMLLHYRLVEKIGEGGMGVVWRASDTTLHRDVAIKFLPETFARDPRRLARLEREATVLASLNHPNIAAVYGLHVSDDGDRFLAMELVKGEELARRIRRGPMALEEALKIARQIADALESAHESGIVHRDLKPSNIMLSDDDRVRVLDFGLAKATPPDEPDTEAPTASVHPDGLSRAGVAFGTPAYMSPEQAHGRIVDRRADIWAFGCVLYEMVTGRPVYEGESVSDTLAAVLRSEPDFSVVPASTPATVSRLLHRCLCKDLRKRLQSIGEARIAIEEYQADPDGFPAPASRGRERLAWIAAVAGMLVAAAALVWMLNTPRGSMLPRGSSIRFEILPPTEDGFENGIALSHDGRRLAFIAPGATGEDQLWLRALSNVASRPLSGTEGAAFPFWSPAGDQIAFFAHGVLKTIDVTTGETKTLCPAPEPRGLHHRPAAERMYVQHPDTEPGRGRDCPVHGIGNIVILEIQKHVVTARDEPFDQRRARAGE